MSRVILAFLLGSAAAWIGSAFVPGVTADGAVTTYLLVGLLIAAGELFLPFIDGASAIPLFFLPRIIRMFLFRLAEVAIVARLVNGFGFSPPTPFPGLVGLTLLLTVFFLPLGR